MRGSQTRTLFVSVLVVLVSACGRKAQPATPTPATDRSEPTMPTSQPDDDAARARAAEAARLRAEAARLRETLEQIVFFDYDRAQLHDDTRGALEAKVSILREHPAIRLRIEGHADERGSVEYNLALGLRRAESVRSYLVNFGIAAERLEVNTYGEERPIASGTDEASYARNRRAEFRILSGLNVDSN